MQEEELELIEPIPYQEIGATFFVAGWVPISWLTSSYGQDNRLYTEFIDVDGRTFMGSSLPVYPLDSDTPHAPNGKQFFSGVVQLIPTNVHFIEKSEGRIVLRLSGQKEDTQSVFIPLIVKQFDPKEGANPEIVKKHGKVGGTIIQYNKDLKEYYKELGKVLESREQKGKLFDREELNTYSYAGNWKVLAGITGILSEAEDSSEEYLYSVEDRREDELKEKYKDAIEWRGPLATGLVGKMNGFEFRVYSHDHDKHFHIIHKSKRIDARFSFPEIGLLSYKESRNTISSKEAARIQEFFKDPENFKNLEVEFKRRDN